MKEYLYNQLSGNDSIKLTFWSILTWRFSSHLETQGCQKQDEGGFIVPIMTHCLVCNSIVGWIKPITYVPKVINALKPGLTCFEINAILLKVDAKNEIKCGYAKFCPILQQKNYGRFSHHFFNIKICLYCE